MKREIIETENELIFIIPFLPEEISAINLKTDNNLTDYSVKVVLKKSEKK